VLIYIWFFSPCYSAPVRVDDILIRVGKIIRRMYEESEFMLRLAGKFPAARRLQHLQKV
jgi:hypothetical protein